MAKSPEAAVAPEAVAPAEAVAPVAVDRTNPGFELPVNEQRVQPTEAITDDVKRAEAETLQAERAQKNKERADDQKLNRLKNLETVLESGVRNPEELIEILNNYSYEDLRKIQQERKNGNGFTGAVRAWLRGDKDYYFDKDGKVQHNWKADVGRRLVTSAFNRRTAASAATIGALSAITGGVALASVSTLIGGVAGRLSAEMKDYFQGEDAVRGGTRGARQEIMLAEKERYYELQQLSADYDRLRNKDSEDYDPLQAVKVLQQITDIYHGQGEAAVTAKLAAAEKSLVQKQENLTKLRGKLQTVGEVVGLGAGLGANFLSGNFGKLDLDLWNKVDGQSVFHQVITKHGVLHFVWTSADKAAGVMHGGLTHVLNAAAPEAASNMVKVVAASIIEQGLPVMAASLLAGLTYKGSAKAEQAFLAEEKNRQKEQHGRVGEHIASNRAYLEDIARKNGNYIPQAPKNFEYDWVAQPQTLEKDFDLSQLPRWQEVNRELDVDGRPIMKLDSAGKIMAVGIAGVNVDRNLVAIVEIRNNEARQDARVFSVRTMDLDDFLQQYQPIVRDVEGQPLAPPVATPSSPSAEASPVTTTPPDSGSAPAPTEAASPDSPQLYRGDEHYQLAEDQAAPGSSAAAEQRRQVNPDDIERELLGGYSQVTGSEKPLDKNGYKEANIETKSAIFDQLSKALTKLAPDQLHEAGIKLSNVRVYLKGRENYAIERRIIMTDEHQNVHMLLMPYHDGKPQYWRLKLIYEPVEPNREVITYFKPTRQDLLSFSHRVIDQLAASGSSESSANKDIVTQAESSKDEPPVSPIEKVEPVPVKVVKEGEVIKKPEPKPLEREPAPAAAELRPHTKLILQADPGDEAGEKVLAALAKKVGAMPGEAFTVEINSVDVKGDDRQIVKIKTRGAAAPYDYASLSKYVTQAESPVTSAAPSNEGGKPPNSPELKDWGIENPESLAGKRVRVDDPVDFVQMSEGAVEGVFNVEDFDDETTFFVEQAAGGMVVLQLNGGKLTADAKELLPRITEVIG